MKFGPLQNTFFNADEGAYSIVTNRERDDGQITVTAADGEAGVVLAALGAANLPRMAADGLRQKLRVIHRDGREMPASLTINYPKATGDELRIYRSAKDGFDFEAGDVWYVFRRGFDLVVGCMRESDWRTIGTSDSSDDSFQMSVDSTDSTPPPGYVEFAGRKIARDPSISRKALIRSGFVCEYTGQATPFISKRTGKPYVEAHHLIPLGLQPRFNFSLDRMENIVALNPLWHRAIHHAEIGTVRHILSDLARKRAEFLGESGVGVEELIALYGCEQIL
jgi:predicted HNH restriction endonuclease